MSSSSAALRFALYFAALVAFAIAVGVGAAIGLQDNPRPLFLLLLFAVCASPLLYATHWNGPYSVLIFYALMFLVSYGAMDFVDLFTGQRSSSSEGVLSAAEAGLLAGLIVLVLGYALAVKLTRRRTQARVPSEWPALTALLVGISLWALGTLATYLWQVEILNRAFQQLEGRINSYQAMAVTLGRLVQPLGLLLVAYRVFAGRSAVALLLLIAMLGVTFVVGFVGDSKEVAVQGIALVLVTSLLVSGRIPKVWLGVGTMIVLVAFPVFQAYRAEVLSFGRDRGAAAENLGANLQKALDSRLLERGEDIYGARSFLDRVSIKRTFERIVTDVGVTAEYQNGYTVSLLFSGMIPRVLWPDKPDTSVGQLFNRELGISAFRDVFISVTHFGDLYWNFGWVGLLGGALLMGILLGTIGSRFDLAEHRSVTRILVLTITIYLLVARMEQNIAMSYLVWLRSMIAVAALHIVFSRRSSTAPPAGLPEQRSSPPSDASPLTLSATTIQRSFRSTQRSG